MLIHVNVEEFDIFPSPFAKNCLMTERQFSFDYLKSFLILPLHDEKYFFNGSLIICSINQTQLQDYQKLLIYYLESHRDTVTVQGGHWDARKAATHLVFPPGFVAKDTALTLFRWKPSQRSPPLQPNEAVVSNVLELSAEGAEVLQFKRKVTVGISHSGPDLRGYEVVIKNLTDAERNEWGEAEETVDFRSVSGRGWLLSSIYDTLGLI